MKRFLIIIEVGDVYQTDELTKVELQNYVDGDIDIIDLGTGQTPVFDDCNSVDEMVWTDVATKEQNEALVDEVEFEEETPNSNHEGEESHEELKAESELNGLENQTEQ